MFRFLYKNFLKPVLFLFDAEFVHENMLGLGELIGKFGINPDGKSGLRQNRRRKNLLSLFFGKKYPELKQNIFGIELESPIGLAAGFDYKAKLTQVLPSLGFGFQTVGTITNQPCEGNQKPRLGRLPKSRSLMVNKGFKNKGAEKISKKLAGLNFSNAIGVSIGVTNTEKIKTEE
ncbi:MAG: dihydroorotate dehydrogenase 2, partial [Candidatus Woesebacteria bacterium GW2011_GWC1_43_10b]